MIFWELKSCITSKENSASHGGRLFIDHIFITSLWLYTSILCLWTLNRVLFLLNFLQIPIERICEKVYKLEFDKVIIFLSLWVQWKCRILGEGCMVKTKDRVFFLFVTTFFLTGGEVILPTYHLFVFFPIST